MFLRGSKESFVVAAARAPVFFSAAILSDAPAELMKPKADPAGAVSVEAGADAISVLVSPPSPGRDCPSRWHFCGCLFRWICA